MYLRGNEFITNIFLLGLDSKDSELVLRQKVFGKNKITLSQSKSFWSFVWEALQDKTLFMLEISAFLSLALSFYNPPREDEMDKSFLRVFFAFKFI